MKFENKNVRVTNHCRKTIIAKGFDPEKVRRAVEHPEQVTDVLKYPGQLRAIGEGLAVVLAPAGSGWVMVTVYLDGVLTPPRPDQMNTPEGKRYAERYARGEGRG